MARSFALMDSDTFNMVGSYRSQTEALRVVAEAARRYGKNSPEARCLVLFRQDGPADKGYVAEGVDLVNRALTTPLSVTERLTGAVSKLRPRGVTGSHRPGTLGRGLAVAARAGAKTGVRRAKDAANAAGRAAKGQATKAARTLTSKTGQLVVHSRDGRERGGGTERTVGKASLQPPGKSRR